MYWHNIFICIKYLSTNQAVIHSVSRLARSPTHYAHVVMCRCVSFSQVFSSSLAGLTKADVKCSQRTKQVTQGQACCQRHPCYDFGELKVRLCWPVKLGIINPVLSRTNQLPAGAARCYGRWNMNQPAHWDNFCLVVRFSGSCCQSSTTKHRRVKISQK